jgi:hypothetical protein
MRWKDAEKTILIVPLKADELMVKLAKEVLAVQNACNSVALTRAFAEAVTTLNRSSQNSLGGNWTGQTVL